MTPEEQNKRLEILMELARMIDAGEINVLLAAGIVSLSLGLTELEAQRAIGAV